MDAAVTIEDQMRAAAPSIFAEGKHASRSERYTYIPTIDVLRGLRKEGFEPFMVAQGASRVEGKAEFTKHMIRMRHAGQVNTRPEANEIILINSHDGTSSYQLLSGIFRFVCSNGLIAGDICNDIRVRHSGNVVDDVIEGATRILDDADQVIDRIGTYKAITLSDAEQRVFANAALSLRWDEGQAPVEAERLLRPRRHADNKADLWTAFNRVQENIIKGGVSGRSTTGRRLSTRAIGGVTENVKLNRALWTLADGMAELKRGVIDIEELAVV
jgi:hypothetical protein